ncbi:Gpn-loop GTPase 1 [Dirofilaria immitis]|nr:Gpn-loop GTPase 1 [Dirofilaria immitis]
MIERRDLLGVPWNNSGMEEMNTSESSSSVAVFSGNTTTIIVLGMAGSGKSAFVQRVAACLHQQNIAPYLVNLDPAVATIPYAVNIDIRDTVKYKQVMKEYRLGPNGSKLHKIAVRTVFLLLIGYARSNRSFTWSASGSIITDSLASSFPTLIAFIVDSVRAANPTTFMSNMLYACSILYRTKLPFIVVLNKADIIKPTFATRWMNDFESFQEALDQNSTSYMNDLTRSISLVLDQFYQNLVTVSVSSLTGEGIDDFLKLAQNCVKQYFEVYRPLYDKLLKEKADSLMKETAENLEKLSMGKKFSTWHLF